MKPPHFLKYPIILLSSEPEGLLSCSSFLLPYISACFYSSTFLQNLSSFKAHAIFPILFSIIFMCQLSNYYVSVKIYPFVFYFVLLELLDISPLPGGKVLGSVIRGHQRDTQWQRQHEGNSHQGSSSLFFNSG